MYHDWPVGVTRAGRADGRPGSWQFWPAVIPTGQRRRNLAPSASRPGPRRRVHTGDPRQGCTFDAWKTRLGEEDGPDRAEGPAPRSNRTKNNRTLATARRRLSYSCR